LFHLHLVSDATGETTHSVARACLVQFEHVKVVEHLWTMVRTADQVTEVVRGIEEHPGAVVFTLVNSKIRTRLQQACKRLKLPCISVLEPVIQGLAGYFHEKAAGQPGRQYAMTAEYFDRIDAMNYSMSHDDAQSTRDLEDADIVLVGVSRTSKTPTAMYLANHFGLKTANVPIVPGVRLPAELFSLKGTLVVGLTVAPDRLVQIRRNRLLMLKQEAETDYADVEQVKNELLEARRLFAQQRWPVIDVTRRSIEETAAAIYRLYARQLEKTEQAGRDAAQ
jgi:regulator of PEP synthase PpsR (kinase-PPPase family)